MIENLPIYIAIVFGLTTIAALILFRMALKISSLAEKTNIISVGIVLWLAIHGGLGYVQFYANTIGEIPPKLPLIGIAPLFTLILFLFNTQKGKVFIDSLPLKQLTFISIVRIPVEFVLWWLFLHNTIPELMTFEGVNFDVLAGLTVPLVVYFGFRNNTINKKLLLFWNVAGLLLLLNIVVNALFAFPSVIQMQAFNQPNVGLLYFPFVWLPTFVAPLVIFTHLISLRRLIILK